MNISIGGGITSLEQDQNNDSINILMNSFLSEAEFIQMIKDIQSNKIYEVQVKKINEVFRQN